ncbi:MAG: hypothetical protein Q4B02_12955 [Propionibacteriaceae bacterium]|mgnify:FL=1|nr:hypothetical protein [Propionibacteriaceae bacterium]
MVTQESTWDPPSQVHRSVEVFRRVLSRCDAARRAKLNEIASERNTTPSQLLRDLIDSL